MNGHQIDAVHNAFAEKDAEIARLRAALEQIEVETERTCQQCRLIENLARAALKETIP